MIDKELLKENHDGSLKKLLKIYNIKGDLYKGPLLKISLIADIILTSVVVLTKIDAFKFICTLVDLYIDILPSLLGFNLGAYALLIGLASSDLINKMSKSFETKFTSFQRASSVFGFCVLLQAVALIVAFIFKLELEISGQTTIIFPELVVTILNGLGLLILNFLGLYSILILISVIGSIFAISQAAHFFAVTTHIKTKLDQEKEKQAKNPPVE